MGNEAMAEQVQRQAGRIDPATLERMEREADAKKKSMAQMEQAAREKEWSNLRRMVMWLVWMMALTIACGIVFGTLRAIVGDSVTRQFAETTTGLLLLWWLGPRVVAWLMGERGDR